MNLATRLFYYQYYHPRVRRLVSRLMRLLFSCDISGPKSAGTGISLEHNALGIVISSEVILGDNVSIYQNVTIGCGKYGYPIIGNNVKIYPNSTIVGGIHIGDNVVIGANSFVNRDLPSNTVYGGVPARLLRKIES